MGFQNHHEAGVGEVGGGAGGGKRQGKWVRSQAGGRGETVTIGKQGKLCRQTKTEPEYFVDLSPINEIGVITQ